MKPADALGLLQPGDWLVLAATAALIAALWGHGSNGDRVVIKQAGRVFLETSPRLDREIQVPGPLGITQVEIRGGRVRIKSDPGLHQICVKQGWLGPGQVAICLPNRVSVERGASVYDSLNY
ncbi:MAG: NusG domain II-containing protein [Parasulfuritortus sp.]|nr:NusG domain II-containing protein [Parasulfuritortus sp.]